MKQWLTAGITLLSVLSLTATTALAQQPAAKDTASIEGVVTRVGSGEPVRGVRVTLLPLTARAAPTTSSSDQGGILWEVHRGGMPPDGPPPSPASSAPAATETSGLPPSPIPFATTDTHGKFAFRNLEAGNYRLWIAANGYVGQEYGPPSNGQHNKQLTLADGQALNLTSQLTPTGSIAGRVLSASGGPAVGVPVKLYEKGYSRFGEPMLQPTQSVARTNDRGEYRIFWITPGRYYVGAGSANSYIPPFSNEVTDPFSLMFYPNENVFETAAPTEVRPGAVVEGLDFILKPQTFHGIRGRVIDTRTGQPPTGAIIFVSGRLSNGDRNRSNEAYYNAATGTFEVPRVQPGEYVLTAQPTDLPVTSAQPAFSATVAVSVVDADVDNVLLSIASPGSIAGQIRADAPLPSRLQVRLEQARFFTGMLDVPTVLAAADGTFTFKAQRDSPMEYRVAMAGLPPGWYVKEARLDDRDALISTTLSGNGRLEIVLSSRAGNVSGVIEGAQGGPASVGGTAVLIPDARQRLDLFQTARVERDGRFAFSNVPPGTYRIYAWEEVNVFTWFDPDLLKELEDQATRVRVSESSRETVNVRVIPAGGAR